MPSKRSKSSQGRDRRDLDDAVVDDLHVPREDQDHPDSHNQLPSVEQYKSNSEVKSNTIPRMAILIVFSIATAIALTITGIVVAKKNKSETDSASTPSGRTKRIEEFLFTNQISTLAQLRELGSPHHLATVFVADGDMLQLEYPTTQASAKRFVERYILALLYYHFNGPEWTFKLKFLSGLDHCNWNDEFDTSDGRTVRQGVICNEEGYVEGLNLAWNNLRGTHIAEEIQFLAELETLHMYYNEIGGYFPEGFRQMTNLKGIGLMKMGLIGTIPYWIGELTQLTSLALGDNQMDGKIPDSMESLSNLRILGLDGNAGFMGDIEKLKNLSSLESLYLENNALTGNLHNSNWPNLAELDVSSNFFDGTVPDELLNHPTLQVLDINGNEMVGGFPGDISENNQLEYLAAHNNGFSGAVSDRIAFLKSLKHLDISFNALTGMIPDTITGMTNLHYLATSGNLFASQQIMDLSKLTNLQDLSMKNNELIGRIPDWIGELLSLQLLDLDANDLTGSIPTWIGLLTNLNHLLLNRNKLTGTIPTQIQNLSKLEVLLLDGNSITGNGNAVCNSEKLKPSYFVADCYPGTNGELPEVECKCCTQCCTDDDPSCNDRSWTSNLDPMWEGYYVRQKYTFNLENAPTTYSKTTSNQDDQQLLP